MGHSDIKTSLSPTNDWRLIMHLFKGFDFNINSYSNSLDKDAFILPTESAKINLKGIKSTDFYQQLRRIGKPIIFTRRNFGESDLMILKFTGFEQYNDLIISLSKDPKLSLNSIIIVSPNNLSKLKRRKELQLVNLIKHYFNITYFIKLPINTLNEFLQFAHQEHASLLMLPFKDLLNYLEIIKHATKNYPFITTVFQPDELNLNQHSNVLSLNHPKA